MKTVGNAALLNTAKVFVHAGGLEDYGITSPIECIAVYSLLSVTAMTGTRTTGNKSLPTGRGNGR